MFSIITPTFNRQNIISNSIDSSISFLNELNDPKKIETRTLDYEERFANPFIAAERGFLDDVIIPSNSRFRLIQAFSKLKNKTQKNPDKKFGNIPL